MFDIYQSPFSSDDERDEEREEEYIDGLMEEFVASPEAQPIIERFGSIQWASWMLQYDFDYLGVAVPEMSVHDFNEVVFELLPRKVSTEPESATEIIAELRAFWSFIHRQYGLTNARKILLTLTGNAESRLREELSNPANFGMAKSFFMIGQAAGFDMTTQEGLNDFMLAYNKQILNARGAHLPAPLSMYRGEEEDTDFELPPPAPASHKTPKQRHEERRKARKAQKRNRR